MFLEEGFSVIVLFVHLGIGFSSILDIPAARVADGIARVILPQRSQENKRDEPHEEQHHHEGIEDAEPMDLMLEEGMIQIAIETGMEGSVRFGPLNIQFEFHLDPRLDLRERCRLGCQIDLDDSIGVVTHVQRPLGVNIRLELPPVLSVLRHRLLEVAQVVPKMFSLGGFQIGEHFPHHSPNGEVVDVHLVEPLILGGRGEELDLLGGEALGGARFQNPRVRRGGNGRIN
mmetsp:Transcript_5160/g.9227  ORF Transcript_5160/g.9227 Transcript_5160/m.9227 type:complete len:230 (-) Transcript_5160:364-1053(-)